MGKLIEKLENYYDKNYLPMHMPGHKRNLELLGEKLPYKIDITEIEGFDDLHHSTGIIKDIEEKARKIYGSKRSFLLVNGSTCGILSGIRAMTKYGDKVLVARNSHKSVYNAIELNGLNPIYLLPKIDKYGIDRNIDYKDVEKILENNRDVKLVILTSPTYEGIISDIKKIVDVAHKYNVPVLVDEAHGAHLKFINKISKNEAINAKADVVIQSLHKTLPALTGTAILHIQGDYVKEENIERELSIFETSSPSYILISSIEECLDIIIKKGQELFKKYEENLKYFYKETKKLKKLKILGNKILEEKTNNEDEYYDFGKIVVLTNNCKITGKELADILRTNYKIELEMSSVNYALAMTSICDTKENFKRLLQALKEIDDKLETEKVKKVKKVEEIEKTRKIKEIQIEIPKREKNISDAIKDESIEFLDYNKLEGKVLKEYIWVYPPGIPLITPGEIMSKDLINKIKTFLSADIEIRTTYNKFPKIGVIK